MKIALLLPRAIRDVAFETVQSLALRLSAGDAETGRHDIVFGMPMDEYSAAEIAAVRARTGAEIRGYGVEIVDRKFLRSFFDWRDDERSHLYPHDRFARPRDTVGGFDFLDCDRWIFWEAPEEAPIAGLRPYVVGVHGVFSRHETDEDNDGQPFRRPSDMRDIHVAHSLRAAELCFASTEHAAHEAVSVYGVRRAQVTKISALPYQEKSSAQMSDAVAVMKRPYVFVEMSDDNAAGLTAMAETLEHYFIVGGGAFDFVLCGPAAEQIGLLLGRASGAPSNRSIRAAAGKAVEVFAANIKRWPLRFSRKLFFFSGAESKLRNQLLDHATAVWLPAVNSDRDWVSIVAGRAGVHVVAPRHPAVTQTLADWSIPSTTYPFWPEDRARDALASVETIHRQGQLKGGWSGSKAAQDTVWPHFQRSLTKVLA